MKTDWNDAALWYDDYLNKEDTYQEKVIAPNLLRMIAPKAGMRVLDVACGQGYFARLVAQSGAEVTGIDQSEMLIEKAKERAGTNEKYIGGDAQDIASLKLGMFDAMFSVLALENIKDISSMLKGMHKQLQDDGKIVLVLLHPAFRIPQQSDWGYDMQSGVQYRKINKYLSEMTIPIEVSPFNGSKKITTYTFHRSLQWYMKAFRSAGFALTSLEEWISHKTSEPGPRKQAEDTARKEFPLFMALELRKI
jgi:ubiquinone/menaquinone biosynthesis C-methylase UbiE